MHHKRSAFLDLPQEEGEVQGQRGQTRQQPVAQWEKHYLTKSVSFNKVTPSSQRTNWLTGGVGTSLHWHTFLIKEASARPPSSAPALFGLGGERKSCWKTTCGSHNCSWAVPSDLQLLCLKISEPQSDMNRETATEIARDEFCTLQLEERLFNLPKDS